MYIRRYEDLIRKEKGQNRRSRLSKLQDDAIKNREVSIESLNSLEEEAVQKTTLDQKTLFKFLVISKDSGWKGFFDMLMLFVACYNIFSNAYFAAFGTSESFWFLFSD